MLRHSFQVANYLSGIDRHGRLSGYPDSLSDWRFSRPCPLSPFWVLSAREFNPDIQGRLPATFVCRLFLLSFEGTICVFRFSTDAHNYAELFLAFLAFRNGVELPDCDYSICWL